VSESTRHRVFTRAASLWNGGQYHQAIKALADAGLDHEKAAFVRFAQKRNRERYVRIMSRYQP
jgi:hypothetical protein